MKISGKILAPVAVVAAFGLGTVAPQAQTPAQKIGFVDVEKLLAAHPNDKDIKALSTKADAELKTLDTQIKAIDAKGANATAAEKQQRETMVNTLKAKADAYNKQIDPKVAAAEKAIDAAVTSVAKSNGYAVVMAQSVARDSGLVIYADEASTVITDAVIKAIKP